MAVLKSYQTMANENRNYKRTFWDEKDCLRNIIEREDMGFFKALSFLTRKMWENRKNGGKRDAAWDLIDDVLTETLCPIFIMGIGVLGVILGILAVCSLIF